MNLISGKLLNREQSLAELDSLYEKICRTQSSGTLNADDVISACSQLADTLSSEEYTPVLLSLGIPERKAEAELESVRLMLSRKYLEKRLEIELPDKPDDVFTPYKGDGKVRHMVKPLGVLFHIVAGNVDALPVFSVIEGLLTGNINIVKLPGTDNGLSIAFLKKLIDIEPKIADYVHVFDYPSEDIESMKKMADLADAIVIWGGDNAVKSVRQMAEPDTKIIEWGHKISFAYISGSDVADEQLEGIAHNICDSNQLYCSSCQGIYLDTCEYNSVVGFAKRFIKILDKKAQSMPGDFDEYLRAQKALELYTEKLESIKAKKMVLSAPNCGVIAYEDSTLVPSYMFRNCWIKPLPKEKIVSELRKYKNHLQTAALICDDADCEQIISSFSSTGIVRITRGEKMSETYCGMPHDGEFSLRRYVKIVSCDI